MCKISTSALLRALLDPAAKHSFLFWLRFRVFPTECLVFPCSPSMILPVAAAKVKTPESVWEFRQGTRGVVLQESDGASSDLGANVVSRPGLFPSKRRALFNPWAAFCRLCWMRFVLPCFI